MPAKSKKQQMAAGAALSAKRGRRPKSSLKGASRQMVESMSERELHEMAGAERKKLPKRAGAGAKSKSAASKSASAGRRKSSSRSRPASRGKSRSSGKSSPRRSSASKGEKSKR